MTSLSEESIPKEAEITMKEWAEHYRPARQRTARSSSTHRKEIRKLTFRAQALRRSKSRNCGFCVVYIQKYGATLLVGAWQREKQQNKLVE